MVQAKGVAELMHCFLEQTRPEELIVGTEQQPCRRHQAGAASRGDSKDKIEIRGKEVAMCNAEDVPRSMAAQEGEQRLRSVLAACRRVGVPRQRHRGVDACRRHPPFCEIAGKCLRDLHRHAFKWHDEKLLDGDVSPLRGGVLVHRARG